MSSVVILSHHILIWEDKISNQPNRSLHREYKQFDSASDSDSMGEELWTVDSMDPDNV